MRNGRILVEDLETVRLEWREHLKARLRGTPARGALLRQPVKYSAAAATELGIEVLIQISTGRRNRIWLAKNVVRVLDEVGAPARGHR